MPSVSAYAGAAADAGGGAVAWSSPGNTLGSPDGFNAFCSLTTNPSDGLDLTSYGLSPSGTILGIEVDLYAAAAQQAEAWVAQLLYNGSPIGNSQSLLDGAEVPHIFGGASDVWGTTLTAAQVADTSFGVRIIANGGSISGTWTVDAAQIIVTYGVIITPSIKLPDYSKFPKRILERTH